MEQLTINGFEAFSPNPNEAIDSIIAKGYEWLSDWNSGIFLIGDSSDCPYIPYRVKFPSGKILDEDEIFKDFSELEKMGFSNEEIQLARNLYYAINENPTDDKFCGPSFISKEDEIAAKNKYSENPFFRQYDNL